MRNLDRRSLLGLFLLAVGVYFFREDQGSARGYVLSSLLVIVFWYLNNLSFALSNLRSILFFAAIFGIAFVAIRLAFPAKGESAKMGLSLDGDLNPGLIARLKESHAVALYLSFDHKPTMEERYFKTDSLLFTEDGIHYTNKRQDLDLARLPRTAAWARANVTSGSLTAAIERAREWFVPSFSYTLAPGALHSTTPLDEFLFDSRRGFCEHYAAALTTLLRLRGYKARVSVGFAVGRWNPFFRLLTYEESDAHAWVEVQAPGSQKWRIVDPTEWIAPALLEEQSYGIGLKITAAALFLTLVVMLFLAPARFRGSDAILNKLSAMERKHRLDSAGLTLSERMERIAAYYPGRERWIRGSLAIYLSSYFAQEPTSLEIRKLDNSLAKWGRP